jgi:hypothetical protein
MHYFISMKRINKQHILCTVAFHDEMMYFIRVISCPISNPNQEQQ